MQDSILESIASQLGYDSTDDMDIILINDLIIHINMVFNNLYQLGVGPDSGFEITGANETWSDFTDDNILLNRIKVYVYLKVRVTWDTPTGAVLNAMKDEIKEQEWRIVEQVSPDKIFDRTEGINKWNTI